MAWPWSSVTVRHQVVSGLAAEAWARSRASHGSTGPRPGISPGRWASSSRVASGTVRWLRPVNPAGITPDPGGVQDPAGPGGAEPGGAEPGGAEPGGAEPGGAEPGGAEPGGAEPGGAELPPPCAAGRSGVTGRESGP